jgi:hypothetical protein
LSILTFVISKQFSLSRVYQKLSKFMRTHSNSVVEKKSFVTLTAVGKGEKDPFKTLIR